MWLKKYRTIPLKPFKTIRQPAMARSPTASTGSRRILKSDWGNTLAIYSYKDSAPLDGDWPGQPMLKINGRYYAQIADDATGITLSNYVFDYVHNRTDKTMNLDDNSTDKDKTIHQYQTYDFNDFKKIQTYKLAGQSDPEIVFSFKYKKGVWWNATNNSN